jgi:hypothetical protein
VWWDRKVVTFSNVVRTPLMYGSCLLAGNVSCELNVFEHSLACRTQYVMTSIMLISTLFQVCALCLYICMDWVKLKSRNCSKWHFVFYLLRKCKVAHMQRIDCNFALSLSFSCNWQNRYHCIITIICYHCYTRCLKLYTRNKPCFYGILLQLLYSYCLCYM